MVASRNIGSFTKVVIKSRTIGLIPVGWGKLVVCCPAPALAFQSPTSLNCPSNRQTRQEFRIEKMTNWIHVPFVKTTNADPT